MSNERLVAIYNGSELITSNGFTMQSRFILPVLSRMQKEKLLSSTGADLIQAILTYKFDERKPFPTNVELSEYLGKAVRTIEDGFKSIRKCGILGMSKMINAEGKECANNEYDFAPFFALLEKFITVFHIEGKKDVKISELLKMKVEKKEAKDFSWSENYKDVEKEVVPVVETPVVAEEVTAPAEPVAPACVLPETILKVVEFYNIKPEGIVAVEKAYTSFSAVLDDTIFIDKIVASASKSNFVNYFNTCITKAFATNEQPASKPEAVAPRNSSYNRKVDSVREERKPDWFDKDRKEKEEKARLQAEAEARKTIEQKIVETESIEELNAFLKTITVTSEQQALADKHRKEIEEFLKEETAKLMETFRSFREPLNKNTVGE